MKRIITFGEIMMRLNPAGYLRFVQADSFDASYAGGEANVAVSLANYGFDAAFVGILLPHDKFDEGRFSRAVNAFKNDQAAP